MTYIGDYVWGSRRYRDYLQTKSFVDDVRWEISQNALKVSASIDDLKNEGLTQLREGFGEVADGLGEISGRLDDVDQSLTKGFITLHYDLDFIQSSLTELSAKFDWGIGQLQTAIGGVNDSIQELIRIAKTPEQTWAFEQFDIARDAFRRQLFDDALDHVNRAIQGFQSLHGV